VDFCCPTAISAGREWIISKVPTSGANESWAQFYEATRPTSRLVLLTTRGDMAYTILSYPRDILLVGRESAGVPQACMMPWTRGW